MPSACPQLTDAETTGAALASYAEARVAIPAERGQRRRLPCWGASQLDLAIGGLRFRFNGLSRTQRDALAQTYAKYLPADQGFAAVALETVVEREERDVLRAEKVPALNIHPLALTRSPGLLRIVADEFGAVVPLGGNGPARLWLVDETAIASRTVLENYLRVTAAYCALACGGLLLHSAGIVLEDGAHVFLGFSGAGKSTLARKADAAGFLVLSDDINLVMPSDQGPRAFSLPFAGDLGETAGDPLLSHPVAAFYRLEPGQELSLLPSSREERLSGLMSSAAFVNSDGEHFGSLVEIADALARAVPMRRFRSRREDPFDAIVRALRVGP